MRRNIFDVVLEDISIEDVVYLVNRLFEQEHVVTKGACVYTILGYVERYCFKQWKSRGYCITVYDFLEKLDYDNLKYEADGCLEKCFVYLEIIYNFWMLVEESRKKALCDVNNDFYLLKNVMDDFLAKINYIAQYRKSEEQIIIIEDKPEITAVAEIIKEELVDDVIRYNHYMLKGNVALKRSILLKLGTELEPKRELIESQNKQVASNMFYILNNFNLRHNNCSVGEKHYIKHIAEMDKVVLEKWYDELYQLILLSYLLLDNIDRNNNIAQIKNDIQNDI